MKLFIPFALALSASAANAAPVRFDTGPGATGSYYEIGVAATTWSNALSVAGSKTHAGLTGHLATITSDEEHVFVGNLLAAAQSSITATDKQIAWIALSDAASEGNWVWQAGPEAGSTATYLPWLGGEPNSSGGDEDYVHMTVTRAFGWNDIDPFFSFAYVIEYSDPDWSAPSIPLPAGGVLLLGGLAGLAALRRKKTAV